MSGINQKEYLKKYLGIGKGSGNKKKKKKSKKLGSGLKIVDDDDDVRLNEEIQVDLTADNDEAPQIVSIIDDRPPSLRIDEETHNKLWKPIGTPDSSDETVKSIEFKGNIKLSNLGSKKVLGMHKNDFLRNKNDKESRNASQKSSIRIDKKISLPSTQGSSKMENKSNMGSVDYDFSPVRQSKSKDISPPRRRKPQGDSDLDNSPPRIRHGNDSFSLKKYRGKEDDLSPKRPRMGREMSPPRNRKNSDDFSPPRKQNKDISPLKRANADSDFSPPRRNKVKKHLDLSPPRKGRVTGADTATPKTIKIEKNIDNSPPRKRTNSPARKKSRWGDSEETSERMGKTLDGKVAGLQNAAELVRETEELKKREDELFKKLSSEVSGANATTIVRRKQKDEVDPEEEERKQRIEAENKEKYSRWGKGLKQVGDANEQIKNDLYEMSKPLARYADDEDLEKHLKDQEREGDPMLAYIRQKKRKKAVETGAPVTQQFEGDAPPNRFGIRPGYRWDGVDRSNGYEKKWFEVQNSRTASIEENYKWSTEDM